MVNRAGSTAWRGINSVSVGLQLRGVLQGCNRLPEAEGVNNQEDQLQGWIMRRTSLGAIAAGTLVMSGQSALGADVGGPTYAMTPSLFSYWTGPYLGGHGGWGWTTTHGLNAEGIFGGAQIGFNYQIMRYFVVGVEGDGALANISRGVGSSFGFPATVTFQGDGLGSLRARFGFAAYRDILLYGTAGGGWGHGRISSTALPISGEAWHTGWSAGGGIEYAFMPSWSIKLEYLHYGLGSATYFGVLNTGNIDVETVKVGINYLFH
jgi:outer membrane immunogenic protein